MEPGKKLETESVADRTSRRHNFFSLEGRRLKEQERMSAERKGFQPSARENI